jgi:hypothetical protein
MYVKKGQAGAPAKDESSPATTQEESKVVAEHKATAVEATPVDDGEDSEELLRRAANARIESSDIPEASPAKK